MDAVIVVDNAAKQAVVMKRVMPPQRPGSSTQIVETPWALIDAVEKRFGRITFDLAATRENCKVRGTPNAPNERFGPGSPRGEDALVENWLRKRGNSWLNPEFGEIKHYAAKCAETAASIRRANLHDRILFLVPASVGSNWWAEHVDKKALVLFTSPRVTFVSHSSPYPKDLAVCVFSTQDKPGYECWRWDGRVVGETSNGKEKIR